MKNLYPQIALTKFCRLLGVTKQAYYQHFSHKEEIAFEHELIIKQVQLIRQNHRHIETRKLYKMLQPFLMIHQIKIGRDALFKLLSDNYLLIRSSKNSVRTTYSYAHFFRHPNLINNIELKRPNELWVSDITYWKIKSGFVYISLITDAYSHKIVGYHVSDSMHTNQVIKALQMAINENPILNNCIHHSDRGFQYCSKKYIQLLDKYTIKSSMTQNGDPLENAIAERINGIIKHEYLYGHPIENLKQATDLLKKSVYLYNQERPHLSIGMLMPNKVHFNKIKTQKLWKNYYKKNPTIVKQ